jgi:enterochelin esterase-like enzyme
VTGELILPEPQSTEFFLILITVFGALVWWLIVAKQLVFRILAACLAFIPAMAFGVAAVNKYYDYYQNWNAAISDLTNQGVQAAANVPSSNAAKPGVKFGTFLGQSIDMGLAAQSGVTVRLSVAGKLSHINRKVYVYLPPQYFQPAYQSYRFPVLELIHGFPGNPQDWITVLSANSTLNSMVSQGSAKPTVLVLPDANGGRGISLQCLNQWHGPQDDTYLSEDVPQYISSQLRVQAPGHGWGIAGYSEGGFCAANMGLQHGSIFSYAGVLSGYFKPSDNQLTDPPRMVSPFHTRRQARANTPIDELQSLPPRRHIASFWLGTGGAAKNDVRDSENFQQLLQNRQPVVQLKLIPGGGHTMYTWRLLLPQMLSWITPRLANEAAAADRQKGIAPPGKGNGTAASSGGQPQRQGA